MGSVRCVPFPRARATLRLAAQLTPTRRRARQFARDLVQRGRFELLPQVRGLCPARTAPFDFAGILCTPPATVLARVHDGFRQVRSVPSRARHAPTCRPGTAPFDFAGIPEVAARGSWRTATTRGGQLGGKSESLCWTTPTEARHRAVARDQRALTVPLHTSGDCASFGRGSPAQGEVAVQPWTSRGL
jgi:hypothetical protein